MGCWTILTGEEPAASPHSKLSFIGFLWVGVGESIAGALLGAGSVRCLLSGKFQLGV